MAKILGWTWSHRGLGPLGPFGLDLSELLLRLQSRVNVIFGCMQFSIIFDFILQPTHYK